MHYVDDDASQWGERVLTRRMKIVSDDETAMLLSRPHPIPIPTNDGLMEHKCDIRSAGITDPDLSKLIARLISMSSSPILPLPLGMNLMSMIH